MGRRSDILGFLLMILIAAFYPALAIYFHGPPPLGMLCFLLAILALPYIFLYWLHRNDPRARGVRSPPLPDPIKNPHLFDDNRKFRADLFDEKGRRRTIVCGPGQTYETWQRCVFKGECCTIYAWPCHGVVVKENPDVVDMAFLGFDRFNPPTHRYPEEERDKENEFAIKLLKIGGKHWSSQSRQTDVVLGLKEAEGGERMLRFFGWDPPDGSGGVWALEFDDDEDLPETARLRMAVTMEERCRILEKLGAKFYKDPKECEGLKTVYSGFHPEKTKLE